MSKPAAIFKGFLYPFARIAHVLFVGAVLVLVVLEDFGEWSEVLREWRE